MAAVHVRPLGRDDAAAWRALRLRALREHPESFTSSYEEDVQQPPQVSEARLASPRVTFWGALQGRELYGMVGLERESREKNRHKAHVVGMYVAPEVAGQGVGGALLDALLAQCRGEGLQCLVLTVTEGNTRAQRLYESRGFRIFGVEPRAIRVGERFLAKNHMVLELTA